MKLSRTGYILGVTIYMLILSACTFKPTSQKETPQSTTTPIFSKFTYQGSDAIYKENPLAENEFYTPILQGCYPDPSITRKGNDYYLINSSFVFYPGVPIFHSTDLVNWTQIGHVLDRPSQLKLEGVKMSGGIYAPDISYNPHNETFYMVTTHIGGGLGNIVVKAKDPAKEWSDPIKLAFDGIDPALFFDDDGKAYLIHNDEPVKALYDGHRVIKMWEYDVENDQVIGTGKVIVDGGVDITQKPIWIEGPHIYKKDDVYYLMCAEGGTGGNHSEVVFKSTSVMGPYVPAEKNPILTQRHLPKDRPYRVEWAGHADLVSTPEGVYYGVFLGCRPNEAGYVNTGRETYILPVDWSGEFPVFKGGLEPLSVKLPLPTGAKNETGKDGFMPNGNFTFEDNFDASFFDYRWISVRGFYNDFASMTPSGLQIIPANVKLEKDKTSPSMLCFRQQHNAFTAETTLHYIPETETHLAGIACMQNENFNYVLGVTIIEEDKYHLVLTKTAEGNTSIISTVPVTDITLPIKLQVSAQGNDYRFDYAVGEDAEYINIGGTVSGDILSTNVAGGFTGCLIGLYATTANDTLHP